MAELFGTDRTSIGRHIRNIYLSNELDNLATCAKIAQVRIEGNRQIVREIPYYNLDMIISVGYRVNSIRGTRFRQWANKILKDYMLRGYAVNQRLLHIESELAEHRTILQEHNKQIDFFVRTSLKPVEGVFYDGQIFDAYVFVSDLVKSATKSIHDRFLIIDETVYHIGASIKDLGKRLFAFSKMEMGKDVFLRAICK